MKASDFMPLVLACCAEVLESMYFTTVLETSSRPPQQPDPTWDGLSFSLHFQGDVHGHFGMRMESTMARTIAANFLGEQEESLTGDEIAEVAGELTNMLCGSIVSRVEGRSKFALSHPEPFFTHAATPEIYTCALETDNGVLEAWISIDPPDSCLDDHANRTLQAAH